MSTTITPAQAHRKEIKKQKRAHKDSQKYNPAAHLSDRLDIAAQVAKGAQLKQATDKAYVFLLSPPALHPEAVLGINFGWRPNVHFVAGRN